MKKKQFKCLLIFFFLCLFIIIFFNRSFPLSPENKNRPAGYLFMIGGGHRPRSLMEKFVSLASRTGPPRLIILTMASSVPEETGPALVKEFKELGIEKVDYYHLSREEALKPETSSLLDGATAIFFSGGDQSRLTAAIHDTPFHQKLLDLYSRGAVIGGTSAGAAVMSEIMITGEEKRKVEEGQEWTTIEAENIITSRGLGFIKEAIVDQHFLRRKRQNRLLSLILENPGLIGLGIDESTAVLVRPDGKLEILGESQVMIIDARQAQVLKDEKGKLGGLNIKLHLLLAGSIFDLKSGQVTTTFKLKGK